MVVAAFQNNGRPCNNISGSKVKDSYVVHKEDDKPFQVAMKNCGSVKVLGLLQKIKNMIR